MSNHTKHPASFSCPDEPRRTERVLRWYRCRLAQWFQEIVEKHGIDPALLEGLVEWFAERPAEFLVWQPWEEYQGSTYSTGRWCLNFSAMEPAVRGAIWEIEGEERRQAYEALGPVTGDDVDRALAVLLGPGPLPPPVGTALDELISAGPHPPDGSLHRRRRAVPSHEHVVHRPSGTPRHTEIRAAISPVQPFCATDRKLFRRNEARRAIHRPDGDVSVGEDIHHRIPGSRVPRTHWRSLARRH